MALTNALFAPQLHSWAANGRIAPVSRQRNAVDCAANVTGTSRGVTGSERTVSDLPLMMLSQLFARLSSLSWLNIVESGIGSGIAVQIAAMLTNGNDGWMNQVINQVTDVKGQFSKAQLGIESVDGLGVTPAYLQTTPLAAMQPAIKLIDAESNNPISHVRRRKLKH